MSSGSDNVPSDDGFKKIAAKLASLRTAATAPRSWLKRTFNPAAAAARQGKFNLALLDALEKAVNALRETVARQEVRLEQIEREVTELRSLSASVLELRERATTAETHLAQGQEEQREKLDQLAAGQSDLGRELRERIQHLLDEQRVCIRQLSLKTSEEAVLADRARRATELRLEELAQRLPERPA
jgi:hypothetical protein